MPIEQPLVDAWVVTLDLPDDWEVDRLPARPEMIVARPRGTDGWFLSIEPVALGVSSLWDMAQATMRKHIAGAPDHFELSPAIVDGRGAFRFDWTDGVMNNVTWWLQLAERHAARIEYGDPTRQFWQDGGGSHEIAQAATSLVRAVSFIDRRAP